MGGRTARCVGRTVGRCEGAQEVLSAIYLQIQKKKVKKKKENLQHKLQSRSGEARPPPSRQLYVASNKHSVVNTCARVTREDIFADIRVHVFLE